MSKIFIVAKYEYRNTVKKKTFLFMALFIPLIIALPIFFSATYQHNMMNGPRPSTGFVDDSGFLEPDNEYIKYSDISQAKSALLAGGISSFFSLNPDYFTSGNVTVYSLGSSQAVVISSKRSTIFAKSPEPP